MTPMTTLIMLFSLLLGTTLTLTSSHWLLMWMGLEVSTLAIIPLLTYTNHPRSIESAIKYFLTQATASMLLMFAASLNTWMTGHWTLMQIDNTISSGIMTFALAMKLGLAPFHYWVPEVLQGSSLMSGMILLTWQKLAPISIIYQISPTLNMDILLTLAISSTLLGGWNGLNQTQLRKVMAYSSIAHMGWMVLIIIYFPTLTTLNLTLYIMSTVALFTVFHTTNITKTKPLSLMWNKAPIMTLAIILLLLSLGGLPPLTGFAPKWLVIQELIKHDNMIMATVLAITALLNLFFYMRIIYSSTLTTFPTTNNNKFHWYSKSTKNPLSLPTLVILSTTLLPLTPMFITLS
ncbi:NADH dehydrogenase subunit 2 (mitochondrion) [Ornithorhynchus anatinus]|uniref:NADH-ubiquinone oxidoreductase chain 2 n=1 Tax=Ornithorhynchus anatinus TaxID=9258 RepID=NU2M_ORNAN|nr:NADH dehydrogenase subunit 2 [Ornithorhynchus anatinus]Q36451.1 RecName: Full=NADH-ubiquinone oxidoreductase chain 2; AltName: Full=NADH dehydrogenase subunit 2 [Ornithorhynchus anatinus]CAA58456.1 NADH dehydrogenase subunit 2 [Ornithorhynchus anatinus]